MLCSVMGTAFTAFQSPSALPLPITASRSLPRSCGASTMSLTVLPKSDAGNALRSRRLIHSVKAEL
jgi:hypothetical protein